MRAELLAVAIVVALAFPTAMALTVLTRRYALRVNLLDHPKARSSHAQATPRGGGLSIVAVTLVATVMLWILDLVSAALCVALVLGGGMVATVGFIDDRRGVPVRVRLLVHIAAAFTGVSLLGGFGEVAMGAIVLEPGWWGTVLMTLGVVWATNLFNFMDGIDGLAGSQAVTMLAGMGLIGMVLGAPAGEYAAAWLIAAASLGFLVWNWPPASIFMGDVGSGFLGYVIAILALAAGRENLAALSGWLILGSLFILDATLTLFRRLARGERVYEAHRSHAYQWLARRWQSHGRVTCVWLCVNLLCLLPLAALATVQRALSGWLLLSVWSVVAVALWFIGSGRSEHQKT